MRDIGFNVFLTLVCLVVIAMFIFVSLPLFGFDWERSFQLMVASIFTFLGIFGVYMSLIWFYENPRYRDCCYNIVCIFGLMCIPTSICGVLSFGFGFTNLAPVIVGLGILACIFIILYMIWEVWKED